MILYGVLFGLFNCGLGFLVDKYPNLISGYNTMSATKKKNVDIKSIANVLKKALITAGVVTIVLTTAFSLLRLPAELVVISTILPLLIAIMVAVIITQKFDHNVRSDFSRWFPAVLIIIITIFLISTLYCSSKPAKVVISGSKIEFTGMYATTIEAAEIDSISLLTHLPRIKVRTNGSAFGNNLKGNFRLEKFGKCKLFICSRRSPYLYIRYQNGENIIFNAKHSVETDSVFRQIVRVMDAN